MDRYTWLILGGIAGGVLAACRCLSTGKTHPNSSPVATPLGYEQHNAGYETHSPLNVGVGLGYLGTFPSGA